MLKREDVWPYVANCDQFQSKDVRNKHFSYAKPQAFSRILRDLKGDGLLTYDDRTWFVVEAVKGKAYGNAIATVSRVEEAGPKTATVEFDVVSWARNQSEKVREVNERIAQLETERDSLLSAFREVSAMFASV